MTTPPGPTTSIPEAEIDRHDSPAALAARVEHDVAVLDGELVEIDMLIQQATGESERHEAKRAAMAARVAAGRESPSDPAGLLEQSAQLLALTRRAIVMESQVDVLNGKVKVLRRYRDAMAGFASQLRMMPDGGSIPLLSRQDGDGGDADERGTDAADGTAGGARVSTAVSRMILAAQEDLRRDIARAMHDGPAQSLTNIVLQAQIVDRLISSDPAAAKPETRELIAMVQSTLEATKSFIFDVRPMVLDDLGLVPTLRRSARDRGRRAQVPVDFESMGADRRLPMELESGMFRMVEESLAGYLTGHPERVELRLDWTKGTLEAVVRSIRKAVDEAVPEESGAQQSSDAETSRGRMRGRPKPEAEMPAALAAMIEDRRDEKAAAQAASAAPIGLPLKSWRDVQARAATIDARVELADGGSEVRITIDLPPAH
jgi:two-component system, NarL family, sensor histidine kinase DegS